jgi:hypothetical protein
MRLLVALLLILLALPASAQQISTGNGVAIGVAKGKKAGAAIERPAKAKKPKAEAKETAALPVTFGMPPNMTEPLLTAAQSSSIVYLSQMQPVGAVSGTDTAFWCDTASGCGPGVNLKRITAQQIGNYAIGRLAASTPISFNGVTVALNYDSTLTVVGNQLHVVGGGGSTGFPFALGATTVPASASVPAVTSLQLSNPVLAGNVGGTPNYTGVPTYASLSSGTPVFCLGLDSGNHLIKVPASGGTCAGGGGGGHYFAVQGGAAFGIQGGAQFGVQ